MFVQTQETPNPNTLKFLPGKTVSEIGPVQFTNKNDSKNELVRNLLSINGINMVFLGNGYWTNLRNADKTTYKQAVKIGHLHENVMKCEQAIKFLCKCR